MSIPNAAKLAIAMQVYVQKNLQKTSIATNNFQTLLTKTGLRAGSFDSKFPALFSFHGLDIKNTLDQAIKDKDIQVRAAELATEGMHRAISKLYEKYKARILTAEKLKEIEQAIQAFIDAVYTSINNDPLVQNSSNRTLTQDVTVKLAEQAFNKLQALIKQPYLVQYSNEQGRLPSIKILSNSFSNFRDTINTSIKVEIIAVLKENNVTNSKLSNPNYITTSILNWGHTRTGDSILTGKLLASVISLSNFNVSQEAYRIISTDFIQETGQQNTEIKLSRTSTTGGGDYETLELVLQSEYIQKVVVQNRLYNQAVLGQAEKNWNLLDLVDRSPKLREELGVSSQADLLDKLIQMKSSPSMVDNLIEKLGLTAVGKLKTYSPKKYTKPLSSKSTKVKQKSKKVKVSLTNVKNSPGGSDKFSGETLNLTNLQNLLNQRLHDQIRANMGTGSAKNVLNYRSGRLAQSAKVERLSESRAGMIQAFYTYMKYPYATFSNDGLQQSPKSRDPKLLISKSIREIASTTVANRMRAINI